MPIFFLPSFCSLAVNKASVGAFGNPRREDYDHYHHRHLLQNLYSTCYNDITKSKTIMDVVMGDNHDFNLCFVRERAQRWRVNQESALRLLAKHLPRDTADGKCALVEWLRKMNLAHKSGHWTNERSKQCIEMLLMPDIMTALWFEAELGEHFAATEKFHKSAGPHSCRAGFRILEHHGLYLDFVFPWWKEACDKTKDHFPNTLATLASIPAVADRDKLTLQIRSGLLAGKKEVAKMSHLLFSAPLAMILVVHPLHGPPFVRALIAALLTEGVLSLDGPGPRGESPFDTLHATMVGRKTSDYTHYWKQHGFGHAEVVKDILKIGGGLVTHTDIKQFEQDFPAVFECLDAAHGLMTSSSLLAEQIHGSLRGNMTKEQSVRLKNGKQAHVTNNRHDHLQHQKPMARRRFSDVRERRNLKVEDYKDHAEQVGRSLLLQGEKHTRKNLNSALPAGVVTMRSVTRSTRQRDERFAANESRANVVASLNKLKRTIVPLSDLLESSKTRQTENERWVHPDIADMLADVKDLTTKKFWELVPMVHAPSKAMGKSLIGALQEHAPALWSPSMLNLKKKDLVTAVHAHVNAAASSIGHHETPVVFRQKWGDVIDFKVLEIVDTLRGDRTITTNWAMDMIASLDAKPGVKCAVPDRHLLLEERPPLDIASSANGFNYEDFTYECQGDRMGGSYI
jgi:hypothetical protein